MHTQTHTHRPISLMNIDTHILNEILAIQIKQYILKRLHHGHVGFIPGEKGWFKISKLMNVMHRIRKTTNKNHITG